MFRKIALAAAAASLAATPLAAQQAASQVERSAQPATSQSSLGGQNLLFLIGIAVVAGSILLLSEDNDAPVSA